MEKILLDTDIGSDIDDAVCLAYLLAQPRCDLLGVITVQGNAYKRAQLASALISVSGKTVPVFEGLSAPLLGKGLSPEVPQAKVLDRHAHGSEFSRDWLEFARKTITENPREVTLLAIGPLTNVAVLFAVYPELAGLVKQLVVMGGGFFGDFPKHRGPEYNIRGDAWAAEMVYKTKCPVHRSVGLDVTLQVTLSAEEVKRRFKGPLLETVLDMAGVWFENTKKIVFHDPLAAVSIFNPEVVEYETGNVDVDIYCKDNPGFTEFTPDAQGTVEVAKAVNAQMCLDRYFEVF